MVNISMNEEIISKHTKYIMVSTIKSDINKLLAPTFCEIIRNKFGADKEKEHVKFCKYLIAHIDKLENDNQNSLFTAKPNVLHELNESIKTDFPNMKDMISSDKELHFGKRQKYWEFIYDAFGYNKFVGQELLFPLKSLVIKLKKFNHTYVAKLLKSEKGQERIYSHTAYERTLDELYDLLENVFSGHSFTKLDVHKTSLLIGIKNLKKKVFKNQNEFLTLVRYILNICIQDIIFLGEDEAFVLCNYDNSNSETEWGAYSYVLTIGLKVCPYCNRNYITPLYSHKGKVRADLDHYFSKERYPYFSMSIYNLVPCCKFCNSSLKGSKEFSFDKNFHPYEETPVEDLYRFSYLPSTMDCFFCGDDLDIRIEYNEYLSKWERIKANNEVFCIESQYQYHKDIVKNLIKKRLLYDDAYINYLAKTYNKLFMGKDDVIKLLLSSYDYQDVKNAPLGKLLKDIIDELDFS